MSDTLSETEACDILSRLFKARGYAIARNLTFREYGVSFHIDGWDAKSRVGFEFLTSEDDDHDDLTLTEYKALMAAQQRGELSLFILDEVEPLSAAELTATAHEFLDEVAEAARARDKAAARRAKTATKPSPKTATKTAKRPAKKAGKKAAKRAVKKPAKKAARRRRR
jgi:hypothetical protein